MFKQLKLVAFTFLPYFLIVSPSIAFQRETAWGVVRPLDGSTSGGRGEMHMQPDPLLLNEFISFTNGNCIPYQQLRIFSAKERRETRSKEILSNLIKGHFDEFLMHLILGRRKSRRHHIFFNKSKGLSCTKLYNFLHSPFAKFRNVNYLSKDVSHDFFSALCRKVQNLQKTLFLAIDLPKKDMFHAYLQFVAEPELIINYLQEEGRKNYAKAEEEYLRE